MIDSTERARSARLAIAAQIAGIAGIVLCVAIIVAVWLGRGFIGGAIDDLSGSVDSGFGRAIAATEVVAGRLDAASAEVGNIAASANDISTNPSPAPDAVAGLSSRIGRFADAYRALRVQYGEIRENVAGSIDSLQRVARIVPGASVPQGPRDALAAVDAKLTGIDDAVTSIWPAFDAGTPASAAARSIADRATRLQGAVAGASAVVQALGQRLTAVQVDAGRAAAGIGTIILILTFLISALFAWVLILNIALWQLGRIWRRDAAVVTSR